MSSPQEEDPEQARPCSREDLEAYFETGCRAPSDWKIGIEYETPAVSADSGEAIPYEGASGIRAVLESLGQYSQWQTVCEDERPIALSDGQASITLEPGGQVEMSGRPCDSLHCCDEELRTHVEQLSTVETELGVRFLGLGMTPRTPLDRAPWMPKQRYRIMRSLMAETGRLGHRMMLQTATVQANFDYGSERDAKEKFRLSMALAPVLIALSANSPVVDGRASGYKSFRAHVWTDTDPARCGTLPFAFDTEGIFGAYTEYALDVPMYFVQRAGRLLQTGGISFRSFLEKGLDGHRATLSDWTTHLTTLFPEARMKTYIESRSADGQPASRVLLAPALLKGLLYDSDCLTAAWDVLCHWSLDERREAVEQAARLGLDARVQRHRLRDYADELCQIAREGLRRQACRSEELADESDYLELLERQLREDRSPADALRPPDGDWKHWLEAVRFCDLD